MDDDVDDDVCDDRVNVVDDSAMMMQVMDDDGDCDVDDDDVDDNVNDVEMWWM